jgi:uncharacterized membrane protein
MSSSETPPPPPAAAPAVSASEDRTVAILAYITLIGFIVAIVMHGSKKTPIGSYHLRQALGLMLTAFCGYIVLLIIPVIGWICIPFFGLGILVFAIMGLISAVNGQQKPLPLLGEKYQKWFANAFT